MTYYRRESIRKSEIAAEYCVIGILIMLGIGGFLQVMEIFK